MRFWTAGVCVAALLSAGAAYADHHAEGTFHPESYFKLEGGVVIGDDAEFDDAPAYDVDLESGWTATAGWGWWFTNNVRGEVEAGYMTQDFDLASNPLYLGGDVEAYTLMPVLYYDLHTDSRLRPFVGAGAGVGFVHSDAQFAAPTQQDDSRNFAWQASAGLAFDHSDAVAMSLRYRYMDAGEFEIAGAESDYTNHAILAGLSLKFGSYTYPEPEPEPEPEPDPCMNEEKVVYFDFDESAIRPDAGPVLDEAAMLIEECATEVVIVEGHTDTMGSESYNESLGMRRAEAVREALVNRGIAGDMIRVETFGETRPAVDTGDQVREQANRRAVVVIRIR